MRRRVAIVLFVAAFAVLGAAPTLAAAASPPTPRSKAAARAEVRTYLDALGSGHWKKAYAQLVPAQQQDFTEHQFKVCETRGSGFGYLRVIATGPVTRGETHVYGYGPKTLDKATVVFTAAVGARSERHSYAGKWPLVFRQGWSSYLSRMHVREFEHC